MYTRKNSKNKTNFVGHNSTGVELYLSTPISGAKKPTRLTLRAGDNRLDLNGRQIKALREVLAVGFKAWSMFIEPTISVGVWLLILGATLFFVYRKWVYPLRKKISELTNTLTSLNESLNKTSQDLVDIHKSSIQQHTITEQNHLSLSKEIETQKFGTSKMFETVTEAFEFLSTERNQLLKDVADLNRRVRMNSNETKRQAVHRRRGEN